MNKKLIGILIAATIGLTACGSGAVRGGSAEGHALGTGSSDTSGGGGGGNTNSSSNTNTSNTSTNTNNTGESSPGLGVIYGSVSSELKDRATSFATSDTSWDLENIDEVEIDGRRIALIPEGKSPTNGIYESPSTGEKIYTGTSTAPFAQDSSKSWRKIATDLKYARYGEIHDEYEKHHLVVTGHVTENDKMPTANEEVVYKGKALHTKDSYTAAAEGKRPITADSEFRVNFHQHTLAGTIKPVAGATGDNDFTPVTLKGTIKGNYFEGTDTADVAENYSILTTSNGKELVKTGANTKGYFYGPNAEEIAGAYSKITGEREITLPDGSVIHPITTTHGSFGASKQ